MAQPRFGVIVFPGSNCDMDALRAVRDVMGMPAEFIWHQDRDVGRFDAIIVPGGFSYGDYLRAGALARFSPAMAAVAEHAARGKLVLGICNGFQILTEAGLLPGALQRNAGLKFRCSQAYLRVEQTDSPFTGACQVGQVLKIPVAHGEGNYFIDADGLGELAAHRQILFRYCTPDGEVRPEANLNGSVGNIAGICNRAGNVAALMPHPERACEAILGSEDGQFVFRSMIRFLTEGRPARV